MSWIAGLDLRAFLIEDLPVVRSQDAELMVLQVDHLVGLADQGAGIAGQEVLALAQAQDQRTAQASRR